MNRKTLMEKVLHKNYSNIIGLMVWKDDALIYEQYAKGCTKDTQAHVYSVTKTIVSILLGIAIDQGYIDDIGQRILDFYSEYEVRAGEQTIREITLETMLTMTAPYRYKKEPYREYFMSEDWVKKTLDYLGGKDKIGEFRYAPIIGPDVLTGILQKTTGLPVIEFAKSNLFEPLEIHVGESITFHGEKEQLEYYKKKETSGWVEGPSGIHTGGWGLSLSAMDLAKIGMLYLNQGKYQGKQIVSEQWIEESTSVHSRWKKFGYGYLWWLPDESSYCAMGDGGNLLYVNPHKNVVISCVATMVTNAKDTLQLVQDYILPAIDADEL